MPTTLLDGETWEQARARRFKEEAEIDNDGPVICRWCHGSGEGAYDLSVCSECHGSGEVTSGADREDHLAAMADAENDARQFA